MGVIKVNNIDGNTQDAQEKCLSHCHARKGATGCEVIWDQGNRGCYVHTRTVAKGNNVQKHFCWVFSKCSRGTRQEGKSIICLFGNVNNKRSLNFTIVYTLTNDNNNYGRLGLGKPRFHFENS